MNAFTPQYGYHSKAQKKLVSTNPESIFSTVFCLAGAALWLQSIVPSKLRSCTANLAQESRVIYARKAAYSVESSCHYCHSYRWWESMQCVILISFESDHHAVLYETWIQCFQYLLDPKLGFAWKSKTGLKWGIVERWYGSLPDLASVASSAALLFRAKFAVHSACTTIPPKFPNAPYLRCGSIYDTILVSFESSENADSSEFQIMSSFRCSRVAKTWCFETFRS